MKRKLISILVIGVVFMASACGTKSTTEASGDATMATSDSTAVKADSTAAAPADSVKAK